MTSYTPSPPWHFGIQHAGQELDWWSCDDKYHYDINIKSPEYKKYIESKGWDRPGAINYKINKHGFRSVEFGSSKNNFISLGCSFTAGIGLPIEDIWPTLIGQATNLTTCNISCGGNSADTCYRLAEYWIPALLPKLVVFLSPPPARVELATDKLEFQYEVFMPAAESNSYNTNDYFIKQWFLNDENSKINSRKNKLAIESLCNRLKIKFLTYDSFDFMAKSREEVEYARDFMHAGPKAHRRLADQILKDLYE